MIFFTTSYIPTYCDKHLKWYEKTYDWYTLRKWENFEKNREKYINNTKIMTFSEIYKSIGLKPVPGSKNY